MWWLVVVAAIAVGIIPLARSILLVVRVSGSSMRPSYHDGDRVLVVRRRWRSAVRKGDVVVCRSPVPHTAYLVKRVAAVAGDPYPAGAGTVAPDHVFVLGDSPASFDSKDFGPVPLRDLIGVVIRDIHAPGG